MFRLSASLKRAFAVEPPGVREPTPQQAPIVDRICREVVRRRLTTPALMFLEMCRPLNFLGAQAMHFFQPIVSAVVDGAGYSHFAEFLEHRGSLEYLCRRIEHFEAASHTPRRSSSDEPPDAAGRGRVPADR